MEKIDNMIIKDIFLDYILIFLVFCSSKTLFMQTNKQKTHLVHINNKSLTSFLLALLPFLSTITENKIALLAASSRNHFYHPTFFIPLPGNTQTLHFSLSSPYMYKVVPSWWIFCILFKIFAIYCDHSLAYKHSHINEKSW